MSKCPCCSKLDYEVCCKPYHDDRLIPQTPEALMRSRYSAYALANIDYIKKTMQGKPLANFNEQDAKIWANSVKWLKLSVINAYETTSNQGYVEFIARFIEKGQHHQFHELSEFRWFDGRWFYVDGVDKTHDHGGLVMPQ